MCCVSVGVYSERIQRYYCCAIFDLTLVAERDKMAGTSSKIPPPFKEGNDYDVWKNDLELWQILTDLDAKKHAIAVHLSLTGRARSATTELTKADMQSPDAMKRLIAKLDRVFARDKNWKCFYAYLELENYSRGSDCSVDDYLSHFDLLYHKLKSCEVELPDAVLACRLLKSCALDDVHFKLALSTTSTLTFENMRKTLKTLFTDSKVSGNSEVQSTHIKVENEAYYGSVMRKSGTRRLEYKTEGVSASDRSRTRKQASDDRMNPLKPDGSVSICAICSSKMHWAKNCPHAYERNSKQVYYNDVNEHDDEEGCSDEECQITLIAQTDDDQKMNKLLGETIGSVLLDSGCSKTVCGETWLKSFMDTLTTTEKSKIVVEESTAAYRFGDGERMKATKSVTLPCIMAGKHINLKSDVVECALPLLLSRSSMKKAGMVLNLVDDTALIFGKTVKLDMTSLGHYTLPIFAPASSKRIEYVLINEVESKDNSKIAIKLHRQFAHPSAEKLKKLIKDAGKDDPELIKCIDKVTEACETCMKYKKQRPRPVVAMSMASVFNETVAMDLKVFKQGLYFLVIVDIATRFCRATVISDKKPETIVKGLFTSWISLFGAPKKFMSDNGREFNNETMQEMSDSFGVHLVCTAAQSPWSNSICERLNGILGISVNKIVEDTGCSLHIALAWAVAARNALQNCHGYSPNQLVFGFNPCLPNVYDSDLAALEGRTKSRLVADNLNAMHEAREDFVKNEANEKLRRALLHQVRASDVEDLLNGDRVYFKRNEDSKWQGPGIVIGKDGKQVLVRHGGNYVRVHTCRLQRDQTSSVELPSVSQNSSQVRPVGARMDDSDEEHNDRTVEDVVESERDQDTDDPGQRQLIEANVPIAAQGNRSSNLKLKKGDKIEYVSSNGQTKVMATIVSRAGKSTGGYKNCFNVKNTAGEVQWINLDRDVESWNLVDHPENEMLLTVDERSSAVINAKKSEIENWRRNGVYHEVDDIGQPIISARWVFSEKIKEGEKVVKARLVARGFEEKLEDLPTDSPTCAKDTLRLALSVIAANDWKCNSLDVKAAFLQGDSIQRDVFIRPPKEFSAGKLWKLNKTVYGLCDAARSWYLRVKQEFLRCGMVTCKLDQAMFLHFTDGVLSGVVCLHVDDILWAGSFSFEQNVINKIQKMFQIGSAETECFKYVGVNVQNLRGSIKVDQDHYISSIQEATVHPDRPRLDELDYEERKDYRALVGQLNWVATQSRPDILFDVCLLSSVFDSAKVDDLLHANKLVRKVKASTVSLSFPKLQDDNISVECYSDASFGNLNNGGSQGGYVIFITDTEGNKCPVSWRSKRVRRVVKSTMAAETLAALDAAQAGVFIATLLAEMINVPVSSIPVKCFVDNKSLVDALYSTKSVEDKHLRINIAVLRDMLSTRSLSTMSWVRTSHQLANVLTKRGACHRPLLAAIGESSTRH